MLVICAQSWGLIPAHPVSPFVKLVGPMLPPISPPPLTDDLIRWLNESNEGVVVVSLESITRFDPEIIKSIINTLGRVPRRILWAMRPNDKQFEYQLPSNIYTIELTSHFNLLAHPKVELFVIAGGIASLTSGLWHAVPELCLGAHTEQRENCLALERSGAGLALNKESISTDEIFLKLMRILTEERFKEGAKLVSRIYRTDGGAKKAATLIENAMIVDTTGRLVPYGTQLPWYQLQLLDVIAFIFVVGLCFISFAACCFWRMCSYCLTRSTNDNLVTRTFQKCKQE